MARVYRLSIFYGVSHGKYTVKSLTGNQISTERKSLRRAL
jgi:hypothetical protein